jgi:hypothetical protein
LYQDPLEDAAHFEAVLVRLVRVATIGKHEMDKPRHERKPFDLDQPPPPDENPNGPELEDRLGLLVDRLLLS